jgi:DNA-binding NarL/FixJ family response regulator
MSGNVRWHPNMASTLAKPDTAAQEMQIAHLVAEGLSNKEIRERLYLSPRTISSDLYRIFPKLDITSRGQIAGRLGRLS